MRHMHKTLTTYLATFLAIITLCITGTVAFAAESVEVLSGPCDGQHGVNDSASICSTLPPGQNPLFGPEGILTRAISILSMVVAVIAIIVIIVAGIRFTLSYGESQKVNAARNQIIYAAVGIGLALVAQAVVLLVLRKI